MDISNDEITESQLEELDVILKEINKHIEGGYPCRGDDEAMIKAVTNAANYFNGKENTFLEDIVHIKSSYET
jgi:hypothetical protein